MCDFDLTYDQMDYNDRATRRVILDIIQRVKTKTSLNMESNKLFIEAFPYSDGGCIMYVNIIDSEEATLTKKKEKVSFDTPLVFEFNDIDALTVISKRLMQKHSHLITNTSLYLYEGKYRLLIYTYCRMESKLIGALHEYGTYIGKGAVLSAVVHEHAKLIAQDHAIETIVQYLS